MVRIGHETTDWFQTGKEVHQGYILSLCLFNLYTEYIMGNVRLDEAQAGIKISRRNIINLRYADNITLMVESKEEPKTLLMQEKEESEKVGLKLNIQKTKITASGLPSFCHHFMANRWGNSGNSDKLFWGSKITTDGDCSHEIKRHLLLGRKVMINLDRLFKSTDITLPTKIPLVKGFSGSHVWM